MNLTLISAVLDKANPNFIQYEVCLPFQRPIHASRGLQQQAIPGNCGSYMWLHYLWLWSCFYWRGLFSPFFHKTVWSRQPKCFRSPGPYGECLYVCLVVASIQVTKPICSPGRGLLRSHGGIFCKRKIRAEICTPLGVNNFQYWSCVIDGIHGQYPSLSGWSHRQWLRRWGHYLRRASIPLRVCPCFCSRGHSWLCKALSPKYHIGMTND